VIREATRDDYSVFATLFRELAVDDPTPSIERWTSDLTRETLLSERAGRIDGYVSFYTLSTAGHVRHLVVAPDARNAGVGAELMRAAANALRARGVGEWHLNVKRDNAPAIRLYEKLGMQVEHRSVVLRVPWSCVDRLPREPATTLPVAPDEDDDIERTLGLLAGRIAMGRMRSGRVQLQLRDSDCAAIGFASFDPELGASPFRVIRPALAGTLLAALRPHSTGEHVQLVTENDAELTATLVSAGAEVRLELLHYRGELPGSVSL
jgi:GNAT superfamily N-acetyltransferase